MPIVSSSPSWGPPFTSVPLSNAPICSWERYPAALYVASLACLPLDETRNSDNTKMITIASHFTNLQLTKHSIAVSKSTRRSLGSNLAGSDAPLRRNVHDRVAGEEVARPQQKRHGLGRHHREVFRRREVYQAESVPQNDVLILNAFFPVADPLQQPYVGLPGRLRHMSPGRPELVVAILTKSVLIE